MESSCSKESLCKDSRSDRAAIWGRRSDAGDRGFSLWAQSVFLTDVQTSSAFVVTRVFWIPSENIRRLEPWCL